VEVEIEIAGDVVERQELLNGTQIITLEGASADGAWTLTGGLSWNIGLADTATEGDITLTRNDGAELFATLTTAKIIEAAESAETDYDLALTYDIDGGSGALEHARGDLALTGALTGDQFRLRAHVSAEVGRQ
jgi:hypothetical protein